MTWNPYLVARRALHFKRGQRKCSCIGGQIFWTKINNNHWKLIYVTRTIPSSQYETNLWSTHVNIVRLTEPIRRCVRWRTQVFKIEGFVCKRFLLSPPPPPTFIFWLLFHFSRGQNRESRSSVFLCSDTKRKRLLCRLRSAGKRMFSRLQRAIFDWPVFWPAVWRGCSEYPIRKNSWSCCVRTRETWSWRILGLALTWLWGEGSVGNERTRSG